MMYILAYSITFRICPCQDTSSRRGLAEIGTAAIY